MGLKPINGKGIMTILSVPTGNCCG